MPRFTKIKSERSPQVEEPDRPPQVKEPERSPQVEFIDLIARAIASMSEAVTKLSDHISENEKLCTVLQMDKTIESLTDGLDQAMNDLDIIVVTRNPMIKDVSPIFHDRTTYKVYNSFRELFSTDK